MSCCIDFHYLLYYRVISTHCDMLVDLSDGVSWFLSSLSFFQLCQLDREKQFIPKLLSKETYINESVSIKPTIQSAGFPKPKTNFLPTVVTIFFISNKKGGTVEEKGFSEFQKFWPCLRNFISSLTEKNVST